MTYALERKRVWVAGHRGMVGSAVVRRLASEPVSEIVVATSSELDMRRQADVEAFVGDRQPDVLILAAAKHKLYLGNLDAIRNWGHAKDYVRAMWRMLLQEEPKDYVVATGESQIVRRFCELAFGFVGLDWGPFVEVDPKYSRPTEVENLHGDPSLANAEMGWAPEYSFEDLVEDMLAGDLGAAGFSSDEARTAAVSRFPDRAAGA